MIYRVSSRSVFVWFESHGGSLLKAPIDSMLRK